MAGVREIVHALITQERSFRRSGKPTRTAVVGVIYCTNTPIVSSTAYRWGVVTNGKIPPTLASYQPSEVTCPKCLEWVRAQEVIVHTKMAPLRGRDLDYYGLAFGAARYQGETDEDFMQRIKDSVG